MGLGLGIVSNPQGDTTIGARAKNPNGAQNLQRDAAVDVDDTRTAPPGRVHLNLPVGDSFEETLDVG